MTTNNIKFDPIDYVESAYNTSDIDLIKYADTANIWTRLSRVIYSIFDWQPNDNAKLCPTYPNDNNV